MPYLQLLLSSAWSFIILSQFALESVICCTITVVLEVWLFMKLATLSLTARQIVKCQNASTSFTLVLFTHSSYSSKYLDAEKHLWMSEKSKNKYLLTWVLTIAYM